MLSLLTYGGTYGEMFDIDTKLNKNNENEMKSNTIKQCHFGESTVSTKYFFL